MTSPFFVEDGLEVWRTSIDTGVSASPETLGKMSAEDRARYERLIVPSERSAFAESRRVLRRIVQRSKLVASDVEIRADQAARPVFSGNTKAHISWSRSGRAMAVAICTSGSVGIDIEHRRAMSYAPMLAMISDDAERAAFAQIPAHEKEHAFLRLWTIKEAVLKCLGTGFQTNAKRIVPPVTAYAAMPISPVLLTCLDQGFRLTLFEDGASLMCLARAV
jgi:4'-phosphopantetheinyl transferase